MTYANEKCPQKRSFAETSITSEPDPKGGRTKSSATNDSSLEIISPSIIRDIDSSVSSVKNSNEKTPQFKSTVCSQIIRCIEPYPHCILENIFIDGFLEKVLLEVKNNLKVKLKETDLFRVFQSVDMANLDQSSDTKLSISMPSLMKLKETLYSSQYRSFVEKLSGVEPGTLIDKVDSAVNCHNKGCHLLCHDDVIGTRKVSFILYLTDPEPMWKNEDGGRLELYKNVLEKNVAKLSDESEASFAPSLTTPKKIPEPFPVKTVLPKFNSMAFFVVRPGVSFHSVQEVFCDRPRLSIQGWYHAKEIPIQMENASLNQLKFLGHEDSKEKFVPISSDSNQEELSNSDLHFLLKYINPTYLNPQSIVDIQEQFEEESCVQLRHFLNNEWASKIQGCIIDSDTKDNLGRDKPAINYRVGVNQYWKPVGPAHKQRFLEYIGEEGQLKNRMTKTPPKESMITDADNLLSRTSGGLLLHLKRKVFESPAFGRLLKKITSLEIPIGFRGRVRRFRPGLDYTIAHYGILTNKSVLDATMCFVAGSGNQSHRMNTYDDNDAVWQSDDKGGFECYIAAEEDFEKVEAADEYNEEDDTKLLSVSASNNTLSLVYRDPGTMRFIKYVGCGAPSSRWDIAMEYELVDDDDVLEKCNSEEVKLDIR